ncbi:putative ribosome-binding factor A, mitochondrial [Nannospalax galili]|uniref:Ribosome binding factor A n=1 Tax=Nannospalax galili TaxID=1026970 RepID=A0A8C6W5G3_NANGA|nr:putative ribosome-binding factor A, mitochondrial [Nannospalax galili]
MWATAAWLRGSSSPLRALHSSAASCGSKNLLKKFASKTKKKFWYEGPSLGSHLNHKQSKFEFLTKNTSKKTRKEDHVRLRALNGLLYKALMDLLCTPEVSQEVYDLNVELSKVSLTSDFSACRVYWKTGLSADQNKHTQAVLQRSAAYMRHLLITQQTLRNVPPIVFVQDRKDTVLAEVDQLLAGADFGPPDERDDLAQDALRKHGILSSHDTPEPTTHLSLCGIDHEALNKQIMEYKCRKEKGLPCMSLALPSEQKQVTELTPLLRRRKKSSSRRDWDTSPRSFLLGEEDKDEDSTTGYECQTQETEEWEEEAEGVGVQQGFCDKNEQK